MYFKLYLSVQYHNSITVVILAIVPSDHNLYTQIKHAMEDVQSFLTENVMISHMYVGVTYIFSRRQLILCMSLFKKTAI